MPPFVFFNDKIVSADEININAVSNAALYGRGIFTTLAVYNGKPFLWAKHWRRIQNNAAKVGIDISGFKEEFVKNALETLIEKNKTERARITFFDQSPPQIWSSGAENKISLLIQTADFRPTKDFYSLTVSPFPVNSKSPLAGVKSCNYLENILALEEARKRNFDEAVRVNERGEIVSVCMANIFWQRGGKIFTPSLRTGCLAGTTREFVMETREVFEVEETLESLHEAEEIFLTSAGIGAARAGKLQEKSPARASREITQIMRAIEDAR